MMYLFTVKQEEALRKDQPRRNYLKSIKGTIDSYINSKLDSMEKSKSSTDLSCFEEYHLTFRKNGTLKKIWTHPIHKMKLMDGLSFYFEDRIDRRRCKRKIREIFKEISLKNFDLQFELYRTFDFTSNYGWYVYDNTIY
jgi:hypothetical protein